MDQIKIGKFIASTRKELQLTQLDLANKLGITDRAVSKWENGRGLPEISLIKPLCEALSISVNELLSGEKIKEELISEKADTAIVNTLSYSQKKIKKVKVASICVCAGIMALVMLFTSLFAIDINRMLNNKPVFFSTWGFDYAPPIDLAEEQIKIAIKEYLTKHGDSEEKHKEGVKTFVAYKTYLIHGINDSEYKVFAWILQKQCFAENNEIKEYSASSMPFSFTVKKQEIDETFLVSESRYPRDGTYYKEDMKNLFPKYVLNEMDKIHIDGTYERLELEIQEQAKLYFHIG